MSWSKLPGTSWTPRIGGIPTGIVGSTGRQWLLGALGAVLVFAFVAGALWTLGTVTLASGRQVAAIVALVVAVGPLAAAIGFSVTTA